MAQTRMGIEVEVSEDLQGFAATIAGVEKLQDRTVKLTTATINLRKEVETNKRAQEELNKAVLAGTVSVADHVEMTAKLTTRKEELEASLKRTAFAQRMARQELTNLNLAQQQANQNAQIMAAQFGVRLPEAVSRFATRLPAVQTALGLAFNTLMLTSFAAAIGMVVVPALQTAWRWLTDIGEGTRNLEETVKRMNREAIERSPDLTLAQVREINRELERRQFARATSELGPTGKPIFREATLEELNKENVLVDKRNELLEKFNELQKSRGKAATTGAAGRGAAELALPDIRLNPEEQRLLGITARLEAERKFLKDREALQLADEERRLLGLAEINEAEARDKKDRLEAERRFHDERVKLAQEAERDRMEAIHNYAREMESMYDRVIGSARSAKDVLKNIWAEMAAFWRRQVFEMLAAWVMGQRQVSGAGPGGLGGFGGFGIPGAGPGGTPPFNPNPFLAGAFAGAGQGIGFGAVQAGGPGPTTAAAMGFPATMPGGGLFGRIGLTQTQGAGLLGGLTLAGMTVGNRNRVISTLGGAGGGALMGLSIGSKIGSLGGPIGAAAGAAIGAVAGSLIGFFKGGGGKQKEQDAAIASQGFAQLRQIKEDFERQRRDFTSTMDAMQSVWAQMAGAFVRRESGPSQRRWFDIMVEQVRQIEDERNRRRQLLALRPTPEFQEGGLVLPQRTQRGGMLAMVHPGEFVMSRHAVERWGVSLLEGLNQGTGNREQGTGYTLAVWTPSKDFAAKIIEEGIPVVLRKGGAASKILRN